MKRVALKLRSREGFTLVEILIFTAILAIVAVAFSSILVSITRVQVRQSAAAEVNQQSQFLLQTLQRYVESSSLVEMSSDAPTTTLKLRMSATASDPTYIYLSGGVVYLKETENGAIQPLTSESVTVTDLTFNKRANPPGPDSVSIVFTIAYNTSNVQNRYVQEIDTAITRVSAATFDSNVIPSVNNTYKIGASSQVWQSINDLVYFSGSNVGIGASSPSQTLEVNGGVRLNTTNSKPTCDSNQRGTLWLTQGGGAATDTLQICLRNGAGSYLWATLY
jgi:type II secretory pathway pseudopilin PulG